MKVNAIVIGAQKCGTSALWKILSSHPEVACHSSGQFPRFYDAEIPAKQLELALQENFDDQDVHGKRIILRDTTIALEGENISHILGFFPETQVILIVREHVARCRSAFTYAKNKGFEKKYIDIDGVLSDWEAGTYERRYPPLLNYIEAGMYTRIIENVLKAVPQDRLLILRADELKNNQQNACSRLFKFLEVGDFVVPQVTANVTGDTRSMRLNNLMRSDGLIKTVVRNILPKYLRLRLMKTVNELNTMPTSSATSLNESERSRLLKIYSKDNYELKHKYNIDFTASW
jgi:hypothetical protein